MSHALVMVNVGTLDDLGIETLDELNADEAVRELMAPYDENEEMPRYRRFLTIEEKGDRIATHLLEVPRDYSQSRGSYDSKIDYPAKTDYDPRGVLETRVPKPVTQPLDELRATDPTPEVWAAAAKANQEAREAYHLALAAAYTDEEVATAYNARYADDDDKVHVAKQLFGTRPSDRGGRYTKPGEAMSGLFDWSEYNPDSKWDWYQVGGRWRGHFVALPRAGTLIPGKAGVPEDVDERYGGKPVATRTKELIEQRRTDVILAGDIDWDAMREIYRQEVGAYYDEAKAKRPDSPIDWDTKQTPNDITREAYIAQQDADWWPGTSSILDEDDGWTENGTLGWFGHRSDGDMDQNAWRQHWMDYVKGLDPETVLVMVDYHI